MNHDIEKALDNLEKRAQDMIQRDCCYWRRQLIFTTLDAIMVRLLS